MPYLETQGRPRLYYELDDFTDPWRAAPYLILQHGFGRSSRFWYNWVPYLSRFYKVVRPDLRGLGKSTAKLEQNMDLAGLFTGDLIAIIDALGAESVHYCGEAFGGYPRNRACRNIPRTYPHIEPGFDAALPQRARKTIDELRPRVAH